MSCGVKCTHTIIEIFSRICIYTCPVYINFSNICSISGVSFVVAVQDQVCYIAYQLQHIATHQQSLLISATTPYQHGNTMHYTAIHPNTLPQTPTHEVQPPHTDMETEIATLQHTATQCNTLQWSCVKCSHAIPTWTQDVPRCNTLQHTAIRCNEAYKVQPPCTKLNK